jgi:hypothetical protein
MVYLTDKFNCPTGCPPGLLFLKALGTDRIFLFCSSCGCGWPGLPAEDSNFECRDPAKLAPQGISIPSREDIEGAGWGQAVAAEAPEYTFESDLWELGALTAIEVGDPERALTLLNEVIGTWSGPPDTAYFLRAKAMHLCAAKLKSHNDS